MAFQVQTQNHRAKGGPTSPEVGPRQARKAFTLIELLVAISIIGILAGVLLPNFMAARERARDAQRKQDLNQIKKALRLYYNDYQKYPAAEDGKIAGCGNLGTSACVWGSEFSAGSGPTVYMKQLPLGPQGKPESPEYRYTLVDDDNFSLFATLENESDPEIPISQNNCGISTTAPEYYVCAD